MKKCFDPLVLCVAAAVMCFGSLAVAQTPRSQAPVPAPATPTPIQPSGDQPAAVAPAPRLLIGPGDEADITVYGMPDLSQHVRVSSAGEIPFPLIGDVKVAGLTSDEAQALIEEKLVKGNYLKNPHVTFYVKEYTSQGVTVLGEVAHPGSYSSLSSRRLFDAFLAAGGLTQKAGNDVTITRREDPLHPMTITLSTDPVKTVQNNVPLGPGDTVLVSRAGIVYVVGEVVRPGGFVVEQNTSMTVSHVIAMAAGPTRLAKLTKAQLLRQSPSGLTTTEVDVKKIMQAKLPDMPLQAEDILFVPPSTGRMAAERSGSSVLSMLGTLAIYRF